MGVDHSLGVGWREEGKAMSNFKGLREALTESGVRVL